MPIFRDGSRNVLSINNAGTYVDQILPTSNASSVPTNIEAMVGVGSWGPVDAVSVFSSPNDAAGIVGTAMNRPYDIATHVMAAYGMGTGTAFAAVRVSDGTDTAASVTLPSNGGTATALYTGSRGNAISFSFQPTLLAGAYAAAISFPGRPVERFDNILKAVSSFTVTPGSGYTSVPALTLSAPTQPGGVQALAAATLQAVSASVTTGGSGYAVNDIIGLGAGVSVKVLTVSTGTIETVEIMESGSITGGPVPVTVGNQVTTTGSGTGAQFALTFGLGPVTMLNSGYGYSAAPTATLTGGGVPTVAGTITPVVSFWAALAYAINNGTSQRERSRAMVFTPGTSTAAPTVGTVYTLSGGTDGATGVDTAHLVGTDVAPRTGMYALRGSGADCFELCDCTDTETWPTMLAFAQSEGMYAVTCTASGDTIANAIATRVTAGVDDPSIKIIEGDWPTIYDTQNGYSRLVSPCAIYLGLAGNLSPEQSPINKPLPIVLATESSNAGIIIADADESQANNGGIDLIGKSVDLSQDYFSFLTGRNTSSNTAANGDEYTRLTNYIGKVFVKAGKSVVGKLQSLQIDDPTRSNALAMFNAICSTMASPVAGSGGYGIIDRFKNTCDLSNNTPDTQALGFMFLYSEIRYLNVVRYFVVQLAGGGNVTVTVQDTVPTPAQFVA